MVSKAFCKSIKIHFIEITFFKAGFNQLDVQDKCLQSNLFEYHIEISRRFCCYSTIQVFGYEQCFQ